MRQISFSIGCFMFEAPDEDLLTMENRNGKYTVFDWARDVRHALEAIPSVDEITIEEPTGIKGRADAATSLHWPTHDLRAHREPESGHLGGPFIPNLNSGRIAFTLTIPKHVQDRITYRPLGLRSTTFHVDMNFAEEFPVTFIATDREEVSPSMAIVVVREFLYSEFKQRADQMGPIRFSSMGPSPMWVDCLLRVIDAAPEGEQKAFDVKHIPEVGYDRVMFSTSNNDASDAYDNLKLLLAPEVGLYYWLVSERLIVDLNDSLIDSQLEDLLELQARRGPVAWLKRLWKSGRDSVSLRLRVIRAQRWSEAFSITFERERNEVGMTRPVGAFSIWIDSEFSQLKVDRRDKIAEMIDILNSSHSSSSQIVAVVLSSIAGGTVGAALTALITLTGSGAS